MNFGEECGDVAAINIVFAFFVYSQIHDFQIRTQAGLEEQTVIEAVGETIIGIVDGIDDVLRLFFIRVIKVLTFGSGESVQNGDSAV